MRKLGRKGVNLGKHKKNWVWNGADHKRPNRGFGDCLGEASTGSQDGGTERTRNQKKKRS